MKGFTLAVLLYVATAVYAEQYVRPKNADCVASDMADVSLFPTEFMATGKVSDQDFYTEVDFAMGFIVQYYKTYKVLTNQIANETYVLYQCGTTPPAPDAVPNRAKFFQIPLTSVSAPETIPYAYLELLGLDDRVYDVSSFVTAPCGQKILSCGRSAPVDSTNMDNATLLEASWPKIDGLITSFPYNYSESFTFSAAQDPGVLNRAEWIKFLGMFFNREKEASDIFDALVQNYTETKNNAANEAAKSGKTPVVAFMSHYLYEKDESYQLSFADYKEELVKDAGGAIMDFEALSKIPGVRPSAFSNTTLEFAWTGEGAFATKAEAQAAFFKALQGADVVIDETYVMDPTLYDFAAYEKEYGVATVPAAITADLPWLKNKLIFRPDGLLSENLGLDYYEGFLVRPDKAVADVAHVIHAARNPTEAPGSFVWLRQIDQVPRIIGPDACQRLSSCAVEDPSPVCPFVSVCGDGSTVLLTSSASETADKCSYEACPSAAADSGAPLDATNTAQMAAPAVILLTILIVFVEALINFC